MYYLIRQYLDDGLYFDTRFDDRKQAKLTFAVSDQTDLIEVDKGQQKVIASHITVDYTQHDITAEKL